MLTSVDFNVLYNVIGMLESDTVYTSVSDANTGATTKALGVSAVIPANGLSLSIVAFFVISPNVNVPPKCVSKTIQMEALLLLLI